MEEGKRKSVYSFAAESGIYAGAYLCLLAGLFFMSLKYPFANVAIFPVALGFPLLLAWQMRKWLRTDSSYCKISTLWLGGIYTCIFGSLITALFTSVMLLFVVPGFLGQYLMQAADTLAQSPMAADYSLEIEVARRAAARGMLPSPLNFAMTMAWATSFFGSLLSFVLAAIISRSGIRGGIKIERS